MILSQTFGACEVLISELNQTSTSTYSIFYSSCVVKFRKGGISVYFSKYGAAVSPSRSLYVIILYSLLVDSTSRHHNNWSVPSWSNPPKLHVTAPLLSRCCLGQSLCESKHLKLTLQSPACSTTVHPSDREHRDVKTARWITAVILSSCLLRMTKTVCCTALRFFFFWTSYTWKIDPEFYSVFHL